MAYCLINQTACAREAGNPVCPKCGMDERVVYPGVADREAAETAAKARYWEAHARQLEAAQTERMGAKPPAAVAEEKPQVVVAEKPNPQAAWPFATQAPADVPAPEEPEEPEAVRDDELREKTLKRIRNGWIVAAISALMALFFGVMGPAMDFNPLDLDTSSGEHLFVLVEVVLVTALGFGVYRKNRWAAAALFAYFLFTKVSMSIEYETVRPLTGGIVFGYFFFMGMWGCFTWHKHFAQQAPWPFPTSKTP